MKISPAIYWKGTFVSPGQACVPVLSHSFSRGSAIFEFLGFHSLPAGTALFRLDDHVRRFFQSAALLEMTVPLSPGELAAAVRETVRRSGFSRGYVKVMGFYSTETLDVLPPDGPLDLAVAAVEGDPGAEEAQAVPLTTLGLSQWRKLDPQTVPVEAKAAAHYLNGMVARNEARNRGFAHVLMLDTQGFLAEGPTESVFLVRGERLLVPSLGTVLDSITRRTLLAVAAGEGIPVQEGRFLPRALDEVDEIFLASTVDRVLPVSRVENRILRPAPGPVSLRLHRRFREILAGRDARFQAWLTPVA